MLDQQWLKSLIEATRDRLWSGTAAKVEGRSLCDGAGLRAPRSELERLLLLGVVADMHTKSLDRDDGSPSLDSVVAYIRANYRSAKLCRSVVARATGVSESWIGHHCRDELGTSFGELVTGHRLNDATEILVSTNVSVKEVALTVGYTSTSSFTRAFGRRFGIPPTIWRTKHQAPGGRDSWS
jgi:AraC-like DNA-binding protein